MKASQTVITLERLEKRKKTKEREDLRGKERNRELI